MTMTLMLPRARLSAIADPCLGVLVSPGGNIVYWNDTRSRLDMRGGTRVKLALVEEGRPIYFAKRS